MQRIGRILLGIAALAVAVYAAAGALDALGAVDSEIWSHDARGQRGAAALALVLFAGVAASLRLAITAMRAPLTPPAHELAQLRAELRTDTLTGVANRRAFDDDLVLEARRRAQIGSVFSLMAIDVDGLKEINDARGHQEGDAHLRTIATHLRAVVGTQGTVYRTGGDEFMVLLPGRRNWDAMQLAQRIHEATSAPDGTRTVSIGVTETRDAEHRDQLVRQADLALYEAKRDRRAVVPYQLAGAREEPSRLRTRVAPGHQDCIGGTLLRVLDAHTRSSGDHVVVAAAVTA